MVWGGFMIETGIELEGARPTRWPPPTYSIGFETARIQSDGSLPGAASVSGSGADSTERARLTRWVG